LRRGVLRVCLASALLVAGSGCARVVYNFAEVAEERVYRSSQPSPYFLRRLVQDEGIRTLVNLRGRTPGWESAFAAEHGLRLFSFDMSASKPPTEPEITRFLAIVRDPENHPVLIHCRNGVDRTGYMVALFRVHEQGWSLDRAAGEMRWHMQFATLNGVPRAVVVDGLRRPAGTD
jgi:protein tyrosine/serine phosphatase